MPSTASGIPYPLSTDPPNGASQMQAIAAAVEGLIASQGSVSFGTGSALTYTTTTAGATYSTAASCNVTIPAYWGGWRMLAWASGRAASNADVNMRVMINSVAVANSEQNGIAGSMHTMGAASGTGGGIIPVINQMSHASVGTVVQAPNIIAVAIRFS